MSGLAVIADAGLVFDLVVRPQQIEAAAVAARALPEARFVLDHLGKPAIRDGGLSTWVNDVQDLASCSNVVAKFSGLVTEADWQTWTVEDLRPYAQAALELFGADRLLWGSDWPVVNLAGGYQRWLDTARTLIPASFHGAVFGGNALRSYRLDG
jgi:L-fuconolactonase